MTSSRCAWLFRSLAAALLACVALSAVGAEPLHRVAVVYDAEEENAAQAFAEIVIGIETLSGLRVLRMPLFEVDGQFMLARRGDAEPIRLAMAGDGGIAVLFPDLGEPYQGIFLKIIEGIEDKAKTRVASIPIRLDADPAALAMELRRQDIRVVVALGKHGLKAAAGLDGSIAVVVGAVLAVGENEAKDNTVISLAPDPALLFGRLKSLQPGIRRVTVVYSPQANEWLIRLARIAAKAQDIELNALPAEDLKTALKQYMEFFASSNKGDALWLPQDSTTVEESAVVPLVLKESWNRGIPLFSSSLAHVRRGALFALYPDNIELGKDLANFALGYLGSGTKPSKGLSPLRGVMAAVNARTASHLGISLNQHSFNLLLPER
jgi:putative ABC transport system substrate-binding protein